MIPTGGLSVIISLIIILFNSLLKKISSFFNTPLKFSIKRFFYKYRILMALIASSCWILIAFYLSGTIISFGIVKDNNLSLYQESRIKCIPYEKKVGEKNIILRLDDVQAYGWTDISIQMMKDAYDRKMSIVAGVIPQHINTDEKIVKYLKKYDCHVEIAIHGYDHEASDYEEGHGEFAFLDFHQAKEKIFLSKKEISNITQNNINVFIPPHNQISKESILAALEEGLTIIASGKGYPITFHSATWDFIEHDFVPAETIINDCEEVFASGNNLCTIMLHPQDFSDTNAKLDPEKYKEYLQLLDYAQNNNISVITFNDFISNQYSSQLSRNFYLDISETEAFIIKNTDRDKYYTAATKVITTDEDNKDNKLIVGLTTKKDNFRNNWIYLLSIILIMLLAIFYWFNISSWGKLFSKYLSQKIHNACLLYARYQLIKQNRLK